MVRLMRAHIDFRRIKRMPPGKRLLIDNVQRRTLTPPLTHARTIAASSTHRPATQIDQHRIGFNRATLAARRSGPSQSPASAGFVDHYVLAAASISLRPPGGRSGFPQRVHVLHGGPCVLTPALHPHNSHRAQTRVATARPMRHHPTFPPSAAKPLRYRTAPTVRHRGVAPSANSFANTNRAPEPNSPSDC